MASLIARRALSTTARRLATGEEALKSESKKNPEIMVRQIPTGIPDLTPTTSAPALRSTTDTQYGVLQGEEQS